MRKQMATHNDITGDALVSRQANENYRNNYDRIFGKKKPETEQPKQEDDQCQSKTTPSTNP